MRTAAATRASAWVAALPVAVAWSALAAVGAGHEIGSADTLLLAAAVALLTLAALLRPFEPAPGEKFSLAAAVELFAALVLPGAQAVAAVAAAEIAARLIRRSSVVSALVNVSKAVGATGVAAVAADSLRLHPALPPDVEEVLVAGAFYVVAALAPIAVMIAWTRGAREVRGFVAREWLPTAALVAIGALGAVVWAAMPALIVLLVLPLAMVEAAGRSAAGLHRTRDALQKALDAQRAFVSDAAHELRNPLAAVRGNLAFVSESALAREEREALADARREVSELVLLVERLLVMAKADAAAQAGSADLGAVTRDVVKDISCRPGVALDLDIAAGVAVAMPAELAAALVRDLVTNAASYTESGFIRVTVREDRSAALLEVRDTGLGISDAELPRVFDRFFRGAAARRLAPGSGLGLAIARRIAEAHGGSIALAHANGGGTVARVSLPSATPSA